MIPPFAPVPATPPGAEIAEPEVVAIVDDPIHVERQIGRTKASVTLMSGTEVAGEWAAGDSQAFRRLIRALVDVADGSTARVDRAQRLISDQAVGIRQLRDQLRIALDDIDKLRSDRERLAGETAHRIGELMAEVTKLQAAAPTPAITPAVAELLQEQGRLVLETGRLRGAFVTEKRRADAAVSRMFDLEDQLAAQQQTADSDDNIYEKAKGAALAADKAYEEGEWKEGDRYQRLANTLVSLLNVGRSSELAQTDQP